jgi:hypothetical protein
MIEHGNEKAENAVTSGANVGFLGVTATWN